MNKINQETKTIIIAAGMGSRLRPLTSDKPKCLLEVNGKTILDRQLEAMRGCGIRDFQWSGDIKPKR
jgi:L-glutamine-phosphate cytidylyltransferase